MLPDNSDISLENKPYSILDPLYMDLVNLTPMKLSMLGEVKVTNIFVTSSKNFHPDGLFSTDTFGVQGTPARMKNLGYIDLRTSVIHPLVYGLLIKAKRLYGEIMAGRKYAIFNKKTKLFEESDIDDGETGYSFFMRHIDEVQVDDTGSGTRKKLINLLIKYRKRLTITKFIIIPAGLRDYIVDSSGKPTENDINPLYRKLLSGALLFPEGDNSKDKVYDDLRYQQQQIIQNIDIYINTILFGKRKFINKEWADRSIFSGTRNVLTSLIQVAKNVKDPRILGLNDGFCGLFQCCKGNPHLYAYLIRNGILLSSMPSTDMDFILVNKRTLKKNRLEFDYDIYDAFNSDKGLTKLLNSYAVGGNKTKIIEIMDHYLGLIYDGPDEYMFLQDIDDLPEQLETKYVRPITYTDLIYLSVVKEFNELYAVATRYPVLEKGSTYPLQVILKTTIESSIKHELDLSGNRTGFTANFFPNIESGFYDSISLHSGHLGPMGADFDGDLASLNFANTIEAKNEIKNSFTKANYYKDSGGGLLFGVGTNYLDATLKTITG